MAPGPTRTILLLALTTAAAAVSEFDNDQKVMMYVNKVGPYSNPHETYHYYELPVCRPDKIVHKSLSLGEVLDGDRMAESIYDIRFKVNRAKGPLCPSKRISGNELQTMVEAVEESYYFEFVLDDLPMRNFVGRLDEEGLFPHTHKIFLYTHHHFVFEYNGKNIISARVDVGKEPPLKMDEAAPGLDVQFTYSVEWKETTYSSFPFLRLVWTWGRSRR